MKTEDFNAVMAMYGEADRRATAGLIEMLAAAALLKLSPPEAGKASSVTISPADLEDVVRTHLIRADYDPDGTMTVIITRVEEKSAEVTSDS